MTLIIILSEDQWEPEHCKAKVSRKYMYLWLDELNIYFYYTIWGKSHIQQNQPMLFKAFTLPNAVPGA